MNENFEDALAALRKAKCFRAVPMRALSSRVPAADERARFMSSQSAVDHIAAAAGALLGSSLLHVLPNGRLEGMNDLGWVTIALSVTVPSFLFAVDDRVRARERRPSPAAGTGITPSAAPRMPNG